MRLGISLLLVSTIVVGALHDGTQLEARHGTIVVWDAKPEKLIIVADSGVSGSSGKLKSCKIATLSEDTLFFYTGNLAQAVDRETGREAFSQYAVAKDAFRRHANEARSFQRLASLADDFIGLVRPRMNEILQGDPFASTRGGTAGFASLDESNKPRLLILDIPVQVSASANSIASAGPPKLIDWPEDPGQTTGTGRNQSAQDVLEFLEGKTKRSAVAMKTFANREASLPQQDLDVFRLIAGVEASLRWNHDDPDIGGPVDAAALEPTTGVRWIRRKSSCTD